MALLMSPADQPNFTEPLEPGRLTPTPVDSSSKNMAELVPADLFSLPAPRPAAFIASSPTLDREREHNRRQKYLWIGLGIAGHSAATFDAWTTRRVISSGSGYEMDPLLRPFAGNDSIYAAIQAGPLLYEFVGYRMMHSRHAWERHTWWLPQALGMGMNFGSGLSNLRVH